MAWLGFRTLARLAVLADFDEAPPERVLARVPTRGPVGRRDRRRGAVRRRRSSSRCRACTGPSPSRPSASTTPSAKTLAADRVDLESFGAAKRSDRVVLRLSSRPRARARGRRCACARRSSPTTSRGVWLARSLARRPPARIAGVRHRCGRRSARASRAVVDVDLNVSARGSCSCRTARRPCDVERSRAAEIPDGVHAGRLGPRPRPLHGRRCAAGRRAARGAARSRTADVPAEIQQYAIELTGGPHRPAGDLPADRGPLHARISSTRSTRRRPRAIRSSHFLLRSKAGPLRVLRLGGGDDADRARHPGAARHGLLRRRGGTLLARRSSCAPRTCTPGSRPTSTGRASGCSTRRPPAGIPPDADELLDPVAPGRARPRDRVLLRPARARLRRRRPGRRGRVDARVALGRGRGGLPRCGGRRASALTARTAAGLLAGGALVWLIAALAHRAAVRTSAATRAYLALRRLLVAPARTARGLRPARRGRPPLRRGGSRGPRGRRGGRVALLRERLRGRRRSSAGERVRRASCASASRPAAASSPPLGSGSRYRVARAATTVMSSSWGRPASKASTASTIRWQSVPHGRAGVVAEQSLEPGLAELLLGGVRGLGHAVGEDDQEVSRRKRGRRLAVGRPRDHPEGRAARPEPLEGARRPQQHRRVVAGVDPGQRPGILVEDRPEERGEAVRLGQRVHLGVQVARQGRRGASGRQTSTRSCARRPAGSPSGAPPGAPCPRRRRRRCRTGSASRRRKS